MKRLDSMRLSLCCQYSNVLFYDICASMNCIMEIRYLLLLDVHYDLLQKTFTYQRVLCDLLLFLYYKFGLDSVTVHFGYILSTCINLFSYFVGASYLLIYISGI